MEITAAVVREKGGPFLLEQMELEAPRANEVLVRIIATGMCHTDMVARDQELPVPLPQVLGHEGSGIVEAVGSEVHTVAPGDHVVLAFGFCGYCPNCTQGKPSYCYNFMAHNFSGGRAHDGSSAHHQHSHAIHDNFFSQSSFATYALANRNNVIKVPKDVPLELLGPLGCGIQTGAGAILNSLNVPAGSSIAIFGTGAVGMSALLGAKVAGCTTIIAVDINQQRLNFCKELGATHVINSKEENPVERIREITGVGLNYSFDTTGRPAVIQAAMASLTMNGTCGLVGVSGPGMVFDNMSPNAITMAAITVKGIFEGDSVPSVFIPRLIELYKQGQFPFDKLIKFYDFDEINQAAEDSEKGITIKPVIRIGQL